LGFSLALALALTACSPGFDEPWEVKDLRLLGGVTTPPEFLYNMAPPKGPLVVHLDFLWADPLAPAAPRLFRVESCALEQEVACTDANRFVLAEGSAAPGLTGVDLSLPADLLQASFEADPYQGLLGAAVWLQVLVEDGDGGWVSMLKSVVISETAGFTDKVPNTNPTVDFVALVADDDTRSPLPVDAQGVWHPDPDTDYRLLAVMTDASREDYIVPAWDTTITEGKPEGTSAIIPLELSEDLTYRFYCDEGSLSVEAKSEQDIPVIDLPGEGRLRDQSVTFTSPAEGTGTVWMVIDDGRGGAAFVVIPFAVAP
jgi:hypothetical protein